MLASYQTLGFAALLLAVTALWGCSEGPAGAPAPAAPTPAGESDLVAVVDGEPITQVELERALDQLVNEQTRSPQSATTTPRDLLRTGLRRQALDDLVERKVQILEARKQNIAVSDAEIDAFYARLEKTFASPEEHQKVIASLRFTPQEYRRGLADDLAVRKLAEQWKAQNPVEVSDEEVAELYEKRKSLGQLTDASGRVIPLDEVKDKLRAWMISFKQEKEYDKWVTERRSAAQVVILKP
ncbi:SurA N-terminal domain-containing protein [bacterium]|nr:SurA N-terminal domain-containing protein [bacterium]